MGDRQWPATFESNDTDVPGLQHFRRTALVMMEGQVVSVIWGSCTYSTNHDHGLYDDMPFTEEPTTVEVGLWDAEDRLHVLGYVDADGLNEMLRWLAGGGSVETMVEAWQRSGRPMG